MYIVWPHAMHALSLIEFPDGYSVVNSNDYSADIKGIECRFQRACTLPNAEFPYFTDSALAREYCRNTLRDLEWTSAILTVSTDEVHWRKLVKPDGHSCVKWISRSEIPHIINIHVTGTMFRIFQQMQHATRRIRPTARRPLTPETFNACHRIILAITELDAIQERAAELILDEAPEMGGGAAGYRTACRFARDAARLLASGGDSLDVLCASL